MSYEPSSAPLLAELANLRGIGPRRLESLRWSGLYRVDVAAHAEPADVASVSGLRLALAQDVVAATRAFAIRRRDDAPREIRSLLAEFQRRTHTLGEPVPKGVFAELDRARLELLGVLEAHPAGGER